jgi:hypothetical protein
MKMPINLFDIGVEFSLNDVLTFRPIAKQMYEKVVSRLEDYISSNVIECCFEKIRSCDVSFVDEFIIGLQKLVKEKTDVILVLTEVSEECMDNIKAALLLRNKKDKTQLSILNKYNDEYTIIGDIEKNLLETFELVKVNTSITARTVAEHFNVEINSASNKLKKLFDARLILREEIIDEIGRQHVYFLPKI